MADKYVASTGSNTSPYDTWAKAATAPDTAIALATAGEKVYIHAESYTLAANQTWTLGGTVGSPVVILSTNDKAHEPPQTFLAGAKYTQASAANDLTVNGIGIIDGFSFEQTGTSSLSTVITIAGTDDDEILWRNANNIIIRTSTTTPLTLGANAAQNNKIRLQNFNITAGNVNTPIISWQAGDILWENSTISSPLTTAFTKVITTARSGTFTGSNLDFSGIVASSGTLINPADVTSSGPAKYIFNDRKLATNIANMGAFTNVAQIEALFFNCSSGDTHYKLEHYDYKGTTVVDTGIYCNDGATYDGTNHFSWKITTTANANFYNPYISPWIELYHAGVSSITPYMEILRDGSTTPYTDAQAWEECGINNVSGSVLFSFLTDKAANLSTPVDQAAGIGTSGWTGKSGSAWSGKIDSGSAATPNEIGTLKTRIGVGAPSSTVYLDPKIRT